MVDFKVNYNVCHRLWYTKNKKSLPPRASEISSAKFQDLNVEVGWVCNTCHLALSNKTFQHYQSLIALKSIRANLLACTWLNLCVSSHDDYLLLSGDIDTEMLNMDTIPVSVDNMVRTLPRDLENEYAVNVHVKPEKTFHIISESLFSIYNVNVDY